MHCLITVNMRVVLGCMLCCARRKMPGKHLTFLECLPEYLFLFVLAHTKGMHGSTLVDLCAAIGHVSA